jgi:hypothetical protein
MAAGLALVLSTFLLSCSFLQFTQIISAQLANNQAPMEMFHLSKCPFHKMINEETWNY